MAWMHALRGVPTGVPSRIVKVSPTIRPFFFLHRSASAAVTVQPGEVCIEDSGHAHHKYVPAYRELIGTREIVGYGFAGEPAYFDSVVWPYPAIRFRRPEHANDVIKQKEQGDWRNLTVAEKKELYRHSFCETFAEMNAPHGYWRSGIGIMLFWTSVSIWVTIAIKKCSPPLPESFSDENRLGQLKRMIDQRQGAVDGLASHWDYEKGEWKSKPYWF